MNKVTLRTHILIPLAISVIGLIIIEVFARIFAPFPPNHQHPDSISHPILNHKWKPHLSILSTARERPYKMFANKQGWVEQYDINVKKPPNTFRIFFVGDSNIEGVVPRDKKMVEIVEKRLNNRFQSDPIHFEVINTGTTSYSTVIYYLLIKTELLKYSPDLIVINIDMNDVVNDFNYRANTRYDTDGYPASVLPSRAETQEAYRQTPHGKIQLTFTDKAAIRLSKYSALFRWIESFSRKSPTPSTTNLDGQADWLSHNWDQQINRNVEYSMDLLEMIIELLEKNKVQYYVTGVPYYGQFTDKLSSRPHTVLKRITEENNGLFLDSYFALVPLIRGTKQSEYYWERDATHFNEKGNALWAKIHFDFIIDAGNKLLPNL